MGITLAPPISQTAIYKVAVHPEVEGGYWAEVLDLPGCFTQGQTLDEVYHNLFTTI